MNQNNNITNRTTQSWQLDKIHISHNIIDYKTLSKQTAINDSEYVRLHFGLQGSYNFSFAQLNSQFSLSGSHNNIMYSDGLELEVHNKSKRIETFGINFTTDSFIEIGQNGNETLNNFKIQQVISEILDCSYTDALRDLFLLSKSIELLVLQAELYEQQSSALYIKSAEDKRKLIEAKELLESRIDNPFKELFGTTIFGYIHGTRMSLAKRLLLGTDKTAKEIAFQTGYSSPQHFSTAFKKQFGVTPNSVRNTPDNTTDNIT